MYNLSHFAFKEDPLASASFITQNHGTRISTECPFLSRSNTTKRGGVLCYTDFRVGLSDQGSCRNAASLLTAKPLSTVNTAQLNSPSRANGARHVSLSASK